ncbi:uncharacterized protein [Hetaerina americana]|uniref:uncharacterized protein n=1 Tax=Hetaerina americana TaxID=62018 RepID=UPI003A7F1145
MAKDRVHPLEESACQAPPRGVYKAGGAKCSFHGMDYQFQLLMLFAVRAFNLGYSNFSLATEMCDAHKVDDTVFSYGKVRTSTRRHFRFLQAKHANEPEKKKISAANLLDEGNGSMSLKKYFQSFRSISRNKNLLGEDGRVEDLIICTNMDFKYHSELGGLKLKEDIFEMVTTECGEELEDDILKTVLVKFKKEFDGREEIVHFLKKNSIDIPREFALSLLKRRRYVHKRCEGLDPLLYDRYERALVEEVIDPSCGKFRADFVHGKNLSSTAEHFREVITGLLKSHLGEKQAGEEALRSFLASEEVIGNWESIKPEDCLINPKKLGKRLAELARRNEQSKRISVDDEGSLMARSIRALNAWALERYGSEFQFREEFLTGTPGSEEMNEFRKSLVEQLRIFKMDIVDLRGYVFDVTIPSLLARLDEESATLEEEVDSFLDKLVFAVKYSGVPSLEDMIMSEISKLFNPAHKKNVFSRFMSMIQNWLMEKEGRVLDREDFLTFFDGLRAEIEGCLMFELGEPVSSFTGRKRELSRLRNMFVGDDISGGNSGNFKYVNIVGPAGVGKSELARKHAQENLSYYKSVVWIDVGFREHLEESFERLAFDTLGVSKEDADGNVKDLKSTVREVYDYFIGKTCLFVFDGVERDSDLVRFLPKTSMASRLSMIITSRNKYLDDGSEILALDKFTLEESIAFFRSTIGHTPIFSYNQVRKMAETLRYIPLAMQHAAYYIQGMNLTQPRGQFSIADYLDMLKIKTSESADCYEEDELENFSSHPEYVTILITRDFLANLEHGMDALKILNMIVYMSPGNADVGVVKKIWNRNCRACLDCLKACSFIYLRNSKLTVDRSVALVIRTFLRKKLREESILRELLEMSLVINVGHLHTIWSNSVQYTELVKDFSHIPMKIMDALVRNGLDRRAFAFGTKSVEVLSLCVNIDHFSVISILYKMAIGLGDIFTEKQLKKNSRNRGMVDVLRNRLLFDAEHFWQDNTADIKYLMRKGLVLILMRKYHEAMQDFESIVSNRHKILGDNVEFIINLAKLYIIILRESVHMQYEPTETSKELEKFLKNILERMGPENMDYENDVKNIQKVLFYHFVITEIMKKQRRYRDAYQIIKRNYDLCRSALGEGAIASQWIKKDFALILLRMNDIERSVNVLEEVRCSLSKFLDASNVYFLTITRLLALSLSYLGKHVKALQYYKESYNYYRRALGKFHQLTLNLNAYICIELLLLGRTDKAMNFLEPVSALKKRQYFRTLFMQAKRLVNLGKATDAINVLTYVQGAFEESYGEESMETLEVMLELGLAYLKLGIVKSSRQGLQYITKVDVTLEELYSSDNVDVHRMKCRIADILLSETI